MGSHTGAFYRELPILDAARRCGLVLNNRTLEWEEVEAYCPFCGDHGPGKYHLNLNTQKNVYRCNLCGALCINRMVIDGQHRFWAYRQLGYQTVRIYQNVPWVMPSAA